MNLMTDLDLTRRTTALQTLAAKRRNDMKQRWPEIDFDANIWPIRTLYKTKMIDVRFGPTIEEFADRDRDYLLALRCVMASKALEGKRSTVNDILWAWRLLAIHLAPSPPLAALQRLHLQNLEEKAAREANSTGATRLSAHLNVLANALDYLARQGTIDRLMWSPSVETKATLIKLRKNRDKTNKIGKIEFLDRQIEAFSEATSAMLRNDERLNQIDRSVITFTNILMCAPSRVNEPLTCKIGDRFTIEDYATRSEDRDVDNLHNTHQLLLMKGSKGAAWSPKPVLTFMIGLLEKCWQILLDGGKRSRMLVTWYEQHPDQLYLPPELEYLRGSPITRESLWKIVNLSSDDPRRIDLSSMGSYWTSIVDPKGGEVPPNVLTVQKPIPAHGGKVWSKAEALPWGAVETYLLKQVRERMARMRKVTDLVQYDGNLSEMLVLVDADVQIYLPQAMHDRAITARLCGKQSRPSVFQKLGLRLMQGGKEIDCYLNSHDPRRWLTTQALLAGERLSDVLINKWANRLSLKQLDAYDLRSDEQKADQAAMPLPNELTDLSQGLQELDDQASEYGLSTEIVVAHGHGVSITSMETVCQATEDRAVARTGGQILILYPTKFGVCIHQHHETPCRSYKCAPCNENTAVKGHLPTNEEWRKEAERTNRSIVNQLQALITARNRGIADDAEMFDAHLIKLVGEGLDPQTLANDLIESFHDIKNTIRDPSFRNQLEEAFVARGVVRRLDDPEVPSGALIRYRNPKRHASPGHELAITMHFTSREEMDRQSALFYQQHPELAPANLGLQDKRHLLDADDEDDDGVDYDDEAAQAN